MSSSGFTIAITDGIPRSFLSLRSMADGCQHHRTVDSRRRRLTRYRSTQGRAGVLDSAVPGASGPSRRDVRIVSSDNALRESDEGVRYVLLYG